MESVTGVLGTFPKKHLESIYFAKIIQKEAERPETLSLEHGHILAKSDRIGNLLSGAHSEKAPNQLG